METLILYIVKSSICLSLLYLGFICLLRETTWFRFNRSVILWGCFVCTVLPFVQLQLNEVAPIQVPIRVIHQIMPAQNLGNVKTMEGMEGHLSIWQESSFQIFAEVAYIIGCLIVFFITVLSHLKIRSIIRRSKYFKHSLCRLYVSSEHQGSFSFGKSIVIPKEMYDSKKYFDEIFSHEMSHLRHRHSADVLFMQIFIIFHWFNPFVWLLRRELLDIHEYQADNDVINQGINATQYQLLLVKKAVGSRLYILANGFNRSKLKKRIKMMLKKRTRRMAQLRALLFVPLVAGAIYSFATTAPVNTEQDLQWAYPVSESTLSNAYGMQVRKFKHVGIDLKADKGAKIKAAFGGVVMSTASNRGYGKFVMIRHDNGLETLYAHNSENLVKEGDVVKAGQVIALVGNTGRSTAPHCHFEIRKDGILIDPETIFNTTTQTLRAK